MVSDFTENPDILPLLERAENLRLKGKRFSDVEDEEGHQYVDLVQEGGGVLGIALVGYTFILEKAGIRFFSLAGTSAGAINTLLVASLGKPGQAVSEKIIEILSDKNLFDFIDGPPYIRKLLKKVIRKKGGIGWTIAINAFRIYHVLKEKLGMNPGSNFEKWIENILTLEGINTTNDLINLRKSLPKGIKNINNPEDADFQARLAIITAEVTTHTKVEFPKMASLYWEKPGEVSPAKFARASISIPFFFTPLSVKNLPDKGRVNVTRWDEFAGYSGEVPHSVKFVDGGILSNFPIHVFHRRGHKPPRMPSFGVRLSTYRQTFSKTKSVFNFTGAIISTMRQIYDYDFLLRNPDYRQLICLIDADKKFNWLNFYMKKEEQINLFNLGAVKAIEFLENFNWEKYKLSRKTESLASKP